MCSYDELSWDLMSKGQASDISIMSLWCLRIGLPSSWYVWWIVSAGVPSKEDTAACRDHPISYSFFQNEEVKYKKVIISFAWDFKWLDPYMYMYPYIFTGLSVSSVIQNASSPELGLQQCNKGGQNDNRYTSEDECMGNKKEKTSRRRWRLICLLFHLVVHLIRVFKDSYKIVLPLPLKQLAEIIIMHTWRRAPFFQEGSV